MNGPHDLGSVTRLTQWWALPDPDASGVERGWTARMPADAVAAPVPGIIGEVFPGHTGVAWYWTTLPVPDVAPLGWRQLLRFGAVDFRATAWCGGVPIGSHEDGETPFELDVTSTLSPGTGALVAIRVVNPGEAVVDGLTLGQIPHRNKRDEGYHPGWLHDHGGIIGPVELVTVTQVRVSDLFARPELASESIHVVVTVRNDDADAVPVRLDVDAGPDRTGEPETRTEATVLASPGETEHRVRLAIRDPHPWDLDDPYLYRVRASATATLPDAPETRHERSVRCGFRDLRVVDGWFHLNGRRILLRSSHTGNHVPVGQCVAPTPDMIRRDAINAKASGFNMLRFMAGVAWPEQLDFCDEIGLLVYEEPMAAWLLQDSPEMGRRYDASLSGMIRRDRNHPSVAIWGLLTEAPDGPVFRHALTRLELVRELDPGRLVILNSGRFDAHLSIGSVSNPGGTAWEHVWGREAPDAEDRILTPDPATGWLTTAAWINGDLSLAGAIEGNSDTHTYPRVPHDPAAIDFLRTLGHGTKPHMLSEYGIGSLMNVIGESLRYAQHGAREDLLDAALIRSMAERFEADWVAFGLEGIYPFPEDFLLEAQRQHAAYRALGFDIVRSNPQIPAFNVTGLLDHALTGEGFWTFWRQWKPGIMDALWEGWAPLRWCLFADPLHAYPGREIHLEAVLANEDVLRPGQYPARYRLAGPEGVAWEHVEPVIVPVSDDSRSPLAVAAVDVRIPAPARPGRYVFAAELRQGGRPAGGRRALRVTDPGTLATPGIEVQTWGVTLEVESWLRRNGAIIRPLDLSATGPMTVALVGEPTSADAHTWSRLRARIQTGGTALFLSPEAFRRDDDPLGWLPLEHTARCAPFYDWVYHREWVARAHPILANACPPGLLDWDLVGPLLGGPMFEGLPPCEDVAVAAFAVGYSTPGGYASGLVAGSYPLGQGRMLLNTLRILPSIDRHPIADRILLNLIEWGHALSRASQPGLETR